MTLAYLMLALAAACAAAVGFCSPLWYFGFAPLAVALAWSALNLVDIDAKRDRRVTGGDAPRPPRQ